MLLENKNLKLRALEPTDLELLYKWENDTKIWSVSNTLVPYSKYILHQYIENSHQDIFELKQLRLVIDLKQENPNKSIGTIDLFDIDFYHKRAGIGILIADEEYRKKGLASETLSLIEEYSLKHLGLNQLYCHIDEDNKTSLKLFQKSGYEISGKQKSWKKTGQGWKDVYFLQRLLNSI